MFVIHFVFSELSTLAVASPCILVAVIFKKPIKKGKILVSTGEIRFWSPFCGFDHFLEEMDFSPNGIFFSSSKGSFF